MGSCLDKAVLGQVGGGVLRNRFALWVLMPKLPNGQMAFPLSSQRKNWTRKSQRRRGPRAGHEDKCQCWPYQQAKICVDSVF